MMKEFSGILQNYCLLCALFSWLIAQILKSVVNIIQSRRISFVSLFASGGMPSSHSAAVTSLATATGITAGFDSPVFGVTVLFAFIVMYDATGVRRETGRQAEVLNRLLADLDAGKTQDISVHLKTLVGHSPIQVFAGGALGILIALVIYYIR